MLLEGVHTAILDQDLLPISRRRCLDPFSTWQSLKLFLRYEGNLVCLPANPAYFIDRNSAKLETCFARRKGRGLLTNGCFGPPLQRKTTIPVSIEYPCFVCPLPLVYANMQPHCFGIITSKLWVNAQTSPNEPQGQR